MNHVESISNGLGSQSMYLLVLAADKEIPATVSITADTGSENDRLWNTGERTSAREYFDRVVVPFGASHGIETRFVRARDARKREIETLESHTVKAAKDGKLTSVKIPVFGSNGGRLKQSCTDRWKIRAINQELRLMGAKTARTAQGIHYGEAVRRVRGKYIGLVGGWETYATTERRKGVWRVTKWLTHYYPLVDRRLRRMDIQQRLEARGVPYLVSSECDFCPHQDYARWARHTPESLAQSAALEAGFKGEYYLTEKRVPLLQALEQMRREPEGELDFGCGNSYCGV